MLKIGYARVSSSNQNLDRQIGALRAERCHEVYREKASGKAVKGRPQLEKAIDALGKGDVLVVGRNRCCRCRWRLAGSARCGREPCGLSPR
jgi:DNA invertase Pin-like site-specific DNA recombinase